MRKGKNVFVIFCRRGAGNGNILASQRVSPADRMHAIASASAPNRANGEQSSKLSDGVNELLMLFNHELCINGLSSVCLSPSPSPVPARTSISVQVNNGVWQRNLARNHASAHAYQTAFFAAAAVEQRRATPAPGETQRCYLRPLRGGRSRIKRFELHLPASLLRNARLLYALGR